jgi:hypothetical protein
VKASTNRGRRCTGHALARHAETDLFRRFQYLTVPLWVTEDAELRAVAGWRSFTEGWRMTDA